MRRGYMNAGGGAGQRAASPHSESIRHNIRAQAQQRRDRGFAGARSFSASVDALWLLEFAGSVQRAGECVIVCPWWWGLVALSCQPEHTASLEHPSGSARAAAYGRAVASAAHPDGRRSCGAPESAAVRAPESRIAALPVGRRACTGEAAPSANCKAKLPKPLVCPSLVRRCSSRAPRGPAGPTPRHLPTGICRQRGAPTPPPRRRAKTPA
jgi:hypothetical protein